jgi:hypothetical protein
MEYAFRKSRNQYAIGMLEEFFGYYGLYQSLHYADRLVYYAIHWKCYKEKSPSNMISCGDWLKKLLAAARVLEAEFRYSEDFRVDSGKTNLPDLSRIQDFMPENADCKWYYLPRHVSIEQYLDPVIALKKMRKYKTAAEWGQIIDDCVEYSLSKCSIDEHNPGYNMMRTREILLQTIEASHLLLLRYKNFKAKPVMVKKKSGTKKSSI